MVALGNFDIEQLKVPLGFIKVVQIPLALIAYTALHGWRFDLSVFCRRDAKDAFVNATHMYETSSFSLGSVEYKNCSNVTQTIFPESFSGSSTFVGFVSIVSIIFCLAMLFIYLYRYDAYAADDRLPRLDTGITILLAFFWFIAFWMWWRYSSALEAMTAPDNVKKLAEEDGYCSGDLCLIKSYAMYAPVTVSVLAALGSVILFSYNIWIVYKETIWFHQRQMNQQPHMAEPAIVLG
jgi:hypothetical protein